LTTTSQLSAKCRLVIHASDLHIGAHMPETLAQFSQHVARVNPDLIVLSGDLTDGGRLHEYDELARFLSSLPSQVFIVPGNHDSPVDNLVKRIVSPFANFNALGAQMEVCHRDGLLVAELRTAVPIQLRLDWSKGVATAERVSRALIHLSNCADNDQQMGPSPWQILVAHHPLIDAPFVHVPGLVLGGVPALHRCDAAGVDLILSGHTHQSWVGRLEGTGVLLATAPTLSSPRTRGEPQGFHTYRLHECECVSELWQWNGEDFDRTVAITHARRAESK
jgi:3',5'-cyclic AMP phosphodiesterase CpdA